MFLRDAENAETIAEEYPETLPAFDRRTMTVTPEYISREIARGKSYFLVLFMRGPRERSDPVLLDALQAKHLEHMFGLRQMRKLVLNGPSLADTNFRGLCVFDAAGREDVEA